MRTGIRVAVAILFLLSRPAVGESYRGFPTPEGIRALALASIRGTIPVYRSPGVKRAEATDLQALLILVDKIVGTVLYMARTGAFPQGTVLISILFYAFAVTSLELERARKSRSAQCNVETESNANVGNQSGPGKFHAVPAVGCQLRRELQPTERPPRVSVGASGAK